MVQLCLESSSAFEACGPKKEHIWFALRVYCFFVIIDDRFTGLAGKAASVTELSEKRRRVLVSQGLEGTMSDEFFLGLVAGLAMYNNILVDLPFPPAVYKCIHDTPKVAIYKLNKYYL